MRQLIKKDLDELALLMPVITECEQKEFVGGLGNEMPSSNEVIGGWIDGVFITGVTWLIYNTSSFEVNCFYDYVNGGGKDKVLTKSQFNDIVATATKIESQNPYSVITGTIQIKDKEYITKTVSFYSDRTYDYALGTATLIYDKNGVAVGFQDAYDFDIQASGERALVDEIVTQAVGKLGDVVGANSYRLLYGIHQ